MLFSRAVRGGRATPEELTKAAQRWCDQQGYEVVGEHVGARGWREAIAAVADGVADLVVVPSVERLGFGKQTDRGGARGGRRRRRPRRADRRGRHGGRRGDPRADVREIPMERAP
ncbi:hypothetical protein [Micromonospora aurantiaca (nom. illeg.)]|uniref:hypothetical protein n=1 Tax=Micromonospora aurantiaca (nom. illeg.) TaxID=47850 RepID=UPI003F49DFD8